MEDMEGRELKLSVSPVQLCPLWVTRAVDRCAVVFQSRRAGAERGERWPLGQVPPGACVLVAWKLRMFLHFYTVKNQDDDYFVTHKIM